MFKPLILLSAVLALACPARGQQKPTVAGSAALRNVGTGPGNVPALDSAGHLPASLISGVFPATQIGPGTPSSTTILTGTGWAGMTPGGNAVAATGNLLMGDGAGNAAAISAGADLYRVLRTRTETQARSVTRPNNLLLALTFNLHTSTVNSDGTITIAANSAISWTDNNNSQPALPRYAYIVATTDIAANALSPVGIYYEGGPTESTTVIRPAPGVYAVSFSNSVGGGAYGMQITNNTGAPITIYYPCLSTSDPGHPIMSSYADQVPVAPQPVADLDFTRFASADNRALRYLAEKQTTGAFDSVNGNYANAGTLYAPKNSPSQGAISNGSVVGLYRGSVFYDSLALSTLGTTHGVQVQDLALGSTKSLPVISALTQAFPVGFTANGTGTYTYNWTPADASVADDGYQNVYVVEINTATEAAQPVASRRRMATAANLRAVDNAPGTCFVSSPSAGQWTAALHPSDSLAPGSGSYRYEVVGRFCPANWGAPNNLGDGAMSGLELVGGSFGYGSLGSPLSFAGDRLVVLHGSTHNAVLGGGSLGRSVFYENGDGDSIMLAWYASNPTGLSWTTDHCLFYGNVGDRNRDMLISHSGNGQNYVRGDISDCAFLGGRWSDGSLHGVGFSYNNVAGGTINRVYLREVLQLFGGAEPTTLETKNSVFREVAHVNPAGRFHDNIVLATSASDPNNVNNRAPTACALQAGGSASNNILWARGVAGASPGGNDGARTLNFLGTTGTAQRNILILNPGSTYTDSGVYATFPSSVAGLSVDYNLVINLSKYGFKQYTGSGYATSWADYQTAFPTLDQHSMYLDLSADPRGLQAVFVDPANGDFRWAQTDVASQCAAYCRANNVGPATVTSHWPVVPPVDDAVKLLNDL